MEATAGDPDTTAAVVLRRVGNVLIVVGVADIAWMVYAISSGYSYSSSMNIFAVIAGVLLRRQSARTARVVIFYSASMFSGFLAIMIALPLIFPMDLIQTGLRITPAPLLLGWGVFMVAVLALLWWVHRSLTAPEIAATIQSSAVGRRRIWHHPWAGLVFGASLAGILAIVLLLTSPSDTAQRAIDRASAERGPEYRYFVSALSTSWSRGTGTHVRATVLAYTSSSIESVELEWRE